MKIFFLSMIFLSLCPITIVYAQQIKTDSKKRGNMAEKKKSDPFDSDAVKWFPYNRHFNKKVRIQGIGWGLNSKGLGFRVVTPSGTQIYFKYSIADNEAFEKWQGKLIEVEGLLKTGIVPAIKKNPKGKIAQGYTESFEYLYLKNYTIKGISKIDNELSSTEKINKPDK